MGDGEPLALSALEHFAYCPRQCALIVTDGMWTDNRFTVKGTAAHTRVDTAGGRMERGRQVLRHIPLWSERLNLVGRSDAVEIDGDGPWIPVEYKSGSQHGQAAEIQLCAQGLCLEEMSGRLISHGFIWYSTMRRRLRVPFDDALRASTEDTIERVRHLQAEPQLPAAPNDSRCNSCQFFDQCQPGLVSEPRRIEKYMLGELGCAI